jgi:hypothetical protein
MGSARRRVVLVSGALASIVLIAILTTSASAGAGRAPTARAISFVGPIAHVAFPPNGGTETTNSTVPGGGFGEIATDTIPARSTQATVEIKPQVSGQAEYDQLASFLAPQSLKGRILSCIGLTLATFRGLNPKKGISVAFQDENSSLPFLFLVMCVSMAYDIGFGSTSAIADLARASCNQTGFSAPVKITKVGRKYVGVVKGKTSVLRKSPIKVTCTRKRGDLVISIKPARRGQTLRQTAGSSIGVVIANPTKKAVPVTATFTVH